MNRVEFFEKSVIRLITNEFELFSCIKCDRDLTRVENDEEVVYFNKDIEANRLHFSVVDATYREMRYFGDSVSSDFVQCCFKGYVELGYRGIPSVTITDYTIF